MTAPHLDPDELAALEEERSFLLRSLRDLEREHEAGDLDDDDYRALKDDYTARAAGVLHAIDEGRPLPVPAPPASRRRWRVVAVAVGVVVFGALTGELLARVAGERTPGGQVSGSI